MGLVQAGSLSLHGPQEAYHSTLGFQGAYFFLNKKSNKNIICCVSHTLSGLGLSMLTAFCTVLAQAAAAAEWWLAQTLGAAVSGPALLPPEPSKGLWAPAAISPGAVPQPWPLLPWAAVPAPPHLFLPRHRALR